MEEIICVTILTNNPYIDIAIILLNASACILTALKGSGKVNNPFKAGEKLSHLLLLPLSMTACSKFFVCFSCSKNQLARFLLN